MAGNCAVNLLCHLSFPGYSFFLFTLGYSFPTQLLICIYIIPDCYLLSRLLLTFNLQIAFMQLRHFHIILLFLFAALSCSAVAQNLNPYYNFKHLNVENGLAQNIVYHFLQDSRGYMWMGTRDGITLYDGVRTINFRHDDQDKKTIAGNFITRILEDADQQIWIGNSGGIDLFNRNDNSFTHFAIPAADGHLEDTYCVLLGFANESDLWFIETHAKAIKIFNTRTKKFRFVIPTDAVDGMLYIDPAMREVHIWTYLSIGTTHYDFKKDSLIREQHFFSKEKNEAGLSLQVFHVFFQNDTTAWLSTAKGLIELNPVSGNYKTYNKMGRDPVIEIRYVTMSPKGLLWVSTGGYGIYTFDTQTKKFIDNFRNYVSDPFSICNNNIVALYFDNVGNIWCGSYGNGVSYAKVETKLFSKHLSKNEMGQWKKENNVYAIAADQQENIWCILQDVRGFWLLDSSLIVKDFRAPKLENGKPFDGSLYQIFFDGKSSAWCTSDRGLFRYNTISNTMKQVYYPRLSEELFGSYWSNTIIRLHDSSLLFSTMGGLYRISKQNGQEIIQPFSELNKKAFKSFDLIFEDDKNNIYAKDIGGNLYILGVSGTTGNYILKKSLRFSADITQFFEDQANVYIASSQGLFILHKKNLIIEKFSVNGSLPFTSVNNVLAEKNNIWLFGDKGLYYYNLTEKTGRLYTIEDGLPSNSFNEFCIVFTSSGKCIAGTNNGLLAFYPEKLHDTLYAPRAQLINMHVNDSVKSFISNPQETSKITLAHYQNTFSFDFSCISFQHVEACTYEYKLDNYDEHWINSGTTHYTRYSKIPPGKYNFQLRILDAKGKASPYVKALGIEIKNAFWQTTVFKLMMAALFLLFIWLLIKWYLTTKIRKQQRAFEKQQAIEKERTRIATDMHDDLGAGLSSIRFLSEKVKRNIFSDVTKNDIEKILSSSSELMDKMNEIVWAMNEKNDSLPDLLVYIRSYAKEYCEENGLLCEIRLPENIPDVFISGEIRRNIFLTVKESLHNIMKHAGAGEVEIRFHIDRGLAVSIRDNGRGFEITESENKGNGLKNMQKRIESIGGSFKMSNPNGVVIEIQVPLSGI
jgi:signal transduction histidine kinase/ligand-binding sensor domain-containing protein